MSASHHLTLEQVILRLQRERNLKPLCDGGRTLGTLWGVMDYVLGVPQGVSDPPAAGLTLGLCLCRASPTLRLPIKGAVPASLPYKGGDLGSSMRLAFPAHMASLSMGPHRTGLSSLKLLFIPMICKKTEVSGAVGGILYKPVSVAEKISSKNDGPTRNQGDILLPH